ncbi:MAG: ISL3 family transposase [bacterium]|nr:ISL3 family transposase [bacterium]
MRATTLLRRILGVREMFVLGTRIEEYGLVVEVRPSWRLARCGGCGARAPGYDRRGPRRWRHVALLEMRVWLEYAPRRVDCRGCGVRTEAVPWAAPGGSFTYPLEELVAYLAQVTDKTQASRIAGVSWPAVDAVVERVVERCRAASSLEGLRRIGIDEFSYRKHHRYVTTVVDHDAKRVVWAGEGRSSKTLEPFFEALGEEGCAAIEFVTMDLSAAFTKAARERLPQAQIVYDRFHVQRLAGDAVDEVRREIQRDLAGTEEAKELKGSRYALLKNAWTLTVPERARLAAVQETNKPLYRAYLLKETLRDALNYKQPWRAEKALRAWLAWASRSKLAPFVRVARTIRKHLGGVLAYVRERLTNGIVEGFNNRLRMIARRAFGYHGPGPLIAMLFLCCGGIVVRPLLPTRD